MSNKRVSYQNLLKQAIAEFDTSKTVDVKGPMLDPILKWDGDGELPIYKDAASILERYYFNEKADKGVEVSEMEYNEDGQEGKTKSEEHGKGTGTEQAGTGDAGNMAGRKKDAGEDIAKEGEEAQGDGEAVSEKEFTDKDVPKAKKYVDEQEEEKEEEKEEEGEEEEMKESEDVTEDLENAVIEKLIAEMEDEGEEDEEEAVEEGEMNYKGDGVKPGMEAPKEKKASGPEEDTQGSGTEQAGTGTDAGQVPDRKDNADKMVKPKNYNEQEEAPADADEEEGELDVDKEIKEQASGAGHTPPPSMQKKMKGEDQGDDDLYEEAFKIFKEAIEEDED